MTSPTTYTNHVSRNAATHERTGIASLGNFTCASGEVLPNAQLGYHTWGTLNAEGNNVVVLPSYYSGTTESYLPWVGAEALFDPDRFFIVAYDQFGAGSSSKPSTCGGFGAWPRMTVADSVRAAHMVLEQLGVQHVRLVCGWSMGGMQAFSWAAQFPAFIDAALPVCATPACNPVNRVFLAGIRSILDAGDEAQLSTLPAEQRRARLAAFGRVYAGWAYSDEFFLDGEYRELGYTNVDDVLDGWACDHEHMNAEDLLAQLDTWLFSPMPKPCVRGAPNILALPGSTDRYFLPCALNDQAELFPTMRVQLLESTLGHIAGRPGIRASETQQIQAAVHHLLNDTARKERV